MNVPFKRKFLATKTKTTVIAVRSVVTNVRWISRSWHIMKAKRLGSKRAARYVIRNRILGIRVLSDREIRRQMVRQLGIVGMVSHAVKLFPKKKLPRFRL